MTNVISFTARRAIKRKEQDAQMLRDNIPGITEDEVEYYIDNFSSEEIRRMANKPPDNPDMFPVHPLINAEGDTFIFSEEEYERGKEKAIQAALDAFIKDHSGES